VATRPPDGIEVIETVDNRSVVNAYEAWSVGGDGRGCLPQLVRTPLADSHWCAPGRFGGWTLSLGFPADGSVSCWCSIMSLLTGSEDLVRDNFRRRCDTIRRFRPSSLIRSTHTVRALSHSTGGQHAPSTSLTGPIGKQRQLAVITYPVVELRAAAMPTAAPSTTCLLPP
jgi:hypothetical protein